MNRSNDPECIQTWEDGLGAPVRMLDRHEDLQECVLLQRQVWGDHFTGIVPASLLQASRKVGAIVAGAFCRQSARLQGFVFGLSGPRNGKLAHWSHMLAVSPEFRGEGVGRRLKLAQREWALAQGVQEMRWTFDPLVAGNANFNVNRLGVQVEAYQSQMYGDTASDLHSFGTDRVIVCWDLRDEPHQASQPDITDAECSGLPCVNISAGGTPSVDKAVIRPGEESVRIEIPSDVVRLHRNDPELAMQWRLATRAAFLDCLASGYVVSGFHRGGEALQPSYLLQKSGEVTSET